MKKAPVFQIIFVLFLFALANILTGCGGGSQSESGGAFAGSVLKVNLLSKSSMEKSGELVGLGVVGDSSGEGSDSDSLEGRDRDSTENEGEDSEPVSCKYYSGEVVDTMNEQDAPREQNSSEMNHVVLVLSEVQFHLSDGSILSKEVQKTIDLLSLGDGGGIGVSSIFQLPEGSYSKISLHFICSEIHFADGAIEPMSVSESDSIELSMDPTISLDGLSSKEVNITFDESTGLHWADRNGWQLKTEGFQIN